jgi:hypothetical protein
VDQFSLEAQKNSATRINLGMFSQRFREHIRGYKKNPKHHLKKFLSEVEIDDDDFEAEGELALEDYEEALEVKYKGVTFHEEAGLNSGSIERLSNSRKFLAKTTLTQIEKYFPQDDDIKYRIFHPLMMRKATRNPLKFDEVMQTPFNTLASGFGYTAVDTASTYKQWKVVVSLAASLRGRGRGSARWC